LTITPANTSETSTARLQLLVLHISREETKLRIYCRLISH